MRFTFEVHGKPVGEGALTGTRWGGMRHANGERLQPWRDAVGWAAKAQRPPGWATDGPMALHCAFMLPRPQSHYYRRKTGLVLRGDAPEQPTNHATGDLDHYARAVGDALTGIAYADDSQIVHMHIHKYWHDDDGGLLICTVERV